MVLDARLNCVGECTSPGSSSSSRNGRCPSKARSPSSALLPLFLGEGSPTKIDYRQKGTLILTSLLEDLKSKRRVGVPNFRTGAIIGYTLDKPGASPAIQPYP